MRARENYSQKTDTMDFPQLASNIQSAHNALQQNAMRAINQNITTRNWLVGYWIVEFEQQGEDRAKYGEKLLSTLAKTIKIKGLGKSTLNLCRLFYQDYPELGIEIGKYLFSQPNQQIFQSLIGKLQITDNQFDENFQTVSGKLSHDKIFSWRLKNLKKSRQCLENLKKVVLFKYFSQRLKNLKKMTFIEFLNNELKQL